MALQKAIKSFPFTKGLDSKTDAKLAVQPSRIENRVFRGGTLDRRWGTTKLTTLIDGGGGQTKGEALFPFDNELVRLNGGTTYGLGNAAEGWVTKPGGAHYGTVANTRIQRNTRTQTQADQATAGGVTVFAWLEQAAPQQGIHVAVYSESTGTWYQTGNAAVSSTTTAQAPRCVALGGSIVVLWTDTAGKLWTAPVDTTRPEVAPTPATIETNVWTGGPNLLFSAIPYNATTGVCVYMSGATGADFSAFYFNASGAVVSSPAALHVFSAQAAAGGLTCLALQRDTAGNVYFFWTDTTTTTTYYLCASSVWATLQAKTTLRAVKSALITSVEASANSIQVVLGTVDASGNLNGITTGVVNSGGVTTAFAAVPGTSAVALASEACMHDGAPVVCATSSQNSNGNTYFTQPTAWVMDMAGNPLARFLSGTSGGISNNTSERLAFPLLLGTSTNFLLFERGRLAFASALYGQPIDVTPIGLTRVALTPQSASALPTTRLGDSVHIGGALPRAYDGQQVTEAGIPLPPRTPTLGSAHGSAGFLSAAQYQLKVLFSWTDARGQLVRSPPSPPITWTATLNDSQDVTVPPLPLSTRDMLPQGATVQAEFYRTEGNGTVFYRDSSATSAFFNNTAGTAISYTTSQADTTLVAGEILYTTGGILDWLAPPAYSCACVHKGRLVVGGLENPYEWRSSTQWVRGESVRFNEVLGGFVPSETGPITAVASMDGTLIIFTTQAAYAAFGDGPDNLGNNPWPQPQRLVSVDAGALSWNSVCVFPGGILYQNARGLHLLDRGLNASYIGADVEAYGLTFRSATLRPEMEQVWWQVDYGSDVAGAQKGTLVPSNGGLAIVYDYHYGQWSVLTNYGAQDACYYQGKYTRVRSDGVVFQEQPGTFLDSGAAYPAVVETPWIQLADIQGFQRLWYAVLLGTYGSDCTLTWEVAYNFAGTGPTTPTYSEAIIFNGSGILSSGGPLQLRHHIGHKCEAIKFRFTDVPTSESGQGLVLSALTLEYGIRKGAYKLPSAQTA